MNNQKETRLCKAGDKIGYFHCWEQYSRVIEPSLLKGGHPGGTFSQVYALVEIDRKIERVDPTKIEFRDDMTSKILRKETENLMMEQARINLMNKVIAANYGKE